MRVLILILFTLTIQIPKAQAFFARPNHPHAEYDYEINTAPLAWFVDWGSLDLIRYFKTKDAGAAKVGWGLSYIAYNKTTSFEENLPNNKGNAYGIVAILDLDRGNYLATHVLYDKYDKYFKDSTQIQAREGLRANAVIGGQDIYFNWIMVKFGFGVELATYRVNEYNQTTPQDISTYRTTGFNPFFELKAGVVF